MTTLSTYRLIETAEFDQEGYIVNPHAWTPEIAEAIAADLNIELTERHWVVIHFAREEFAKTGEAPTLRRITKDTDVDTKELYALFPGGPGKLAAKIAGLHKPTGCI